MSETRKTITYAGIALLLLLLGVVTAPRRVTPDSFLDRGEQFFPEFTDPNTATTLEVIDFDEAAGAARPFKVTFQDGLWTIPSHHNYPADGKDRLAKTAAGVIGLTKEGFRTNNVADYEACGVIDPLDETATSLKGRGKRVTIKDKNDKILADLIIGKNTGEGKKLRFVRIPDQKRVYVAQADIDISTKFEDWIERDLLKVNQADIDKITLKDYSINERTGRVNQRDVLILQKKGDDWHANRMSSSQEVDRTKMNNMLTAIDELSIVGVRPKPAGLSRSLRRTQGDMPISQPDMLSLRSKGYYFTRDGSLLSNEGELRVDSSDGVTYTLRFGEVVYGTGEAVTAGTDSNDGKKSGPGENRYLFITTSFDPSLFPEPAKPRNTDFESKPEKEWTDQDKRNKEIKEKHDQWKEKVEKGQKTSDELNARFADWYYVISSSSFDKIHLKRRDLVKRKKK
ncbi:MAG: DUF4340 domain-containing protein [Acidobacteriota bacterium]